MKADNNNRQRMESSVIDVSVTDRMRQHKHRNQDPMRRDDIKKPWWSRDSSQMPQNQILTDRESVKFGRNVKNKDSWVSLLLFNYWAEEYSHPTTPFVKL